MPDNVISIAARYESRKPAVPASVPEARAELTSWATAQHVGPETLQSLRMGVTELIGNTVVHAYVGRPVGDVTVIAERVGDGIHLNVIDFGTGVVPRHDSPGLGVGLAITASMFDAMEIHTDVEQGAHLQVRIDDCRR